MNTDSTAKHVIAHIRIYPDGRQYLQPLVSTRSAELAEQCADLVRKHLTELPPVKTTIPSNAKGLRLVKIAEYQLAANAKAAGRLKWIPNPGQQFDSVNDCARKLGVPVRSLHAKFSQMRAANNGSDVPIVIFGLELAYLNPDDSHVSI